VVGVDLVSDVAVGWNGDGRLGLRDHVFFLTEKNMWIAISLLFPFSFKKKLEKKKDTWHNRIDMIDPMVYDV
jgi:hypothetical protein